MSDVRSADPSQDSSTENIELPPTDTKRWSSRRKAAVVVATRAGVITREEACERYMLSEEELTGWEAAFDTSGTRGLRSTALYSNRATLRRFAAHPADNDPA